MRNQIGVIIQMKWKGILEYASVNDADCDVRNRENAWQDIHASSTLLPCQYFVYQHWMLPEFWRKRCKHDLMIISLFSNINADSLRLSAYTEFLLVRMPSPIFRLNIEIYIVILFWDIFYAVTDWSSNCYSRNFVVISIVYS